MACAAAGFYVVLEDVMPAKLRKAEAEYSELTLRVRAGDLELASTVEDAVREADIVVDFVPDELESKLEILSLVDRMAPPKTILCTPSEALSITDLASCVYRPERCVALRGDLSPAGTVWVQYPGHVAEDVLVAVQDMLSRIGIVSKARLDPTPPELIKNL